jgi:hypothetical protein
MNNWFEILIHFHVNSIYIDRISQAIFGKV